MTKKRKFIYSGIAVLALAAAYLFNWNDESDALLRVDEIAAHECVEEFGIDLTGYVVEKGKIRPGKTLSDILLPFGINNATIAKLVEKTKGVFDIRKLASGKDYTLIVSEEPMAMASFFIYEPSAEEFVVFDLRDTIDVYRQSIPVRIEERVASGIIESSLYKTLLDQNLSPALAMEMAEIYAWTIDFYRIQKGDHFRLAYSVKIAGEKAIGVDRIQAAMFHHGGEDIYAFEFEQGDETDYFSEKGESLRRAFLQAPLKFSRITSGFTMKRFHPVQKRMKAHLGTDYAAPTGTPIMAVGDGVVVEAKYKQFNGNYVKIKHNATYTTQYLHMSKIEKGIKPGVRVKQGETIGYVGSTGLATGPHVCFRFWKNGEQVDHRKEKFPRSEPVKSENMDRYLRKVEEYKAKLALVKSVNPA